MDQHLLYKKYNDKTELLFPEILKGGIVKGIGNSILIKLNQIVTFTETLKTINLAKKKSYKYFIVRMLNETEDTTFADFFL